MRTGERMERLTIRNGDGSVSQPMNLDWTAALTRLAAYEDTGLEPEQVKDMAENVETRLLTWFEAEYGFPVGKLMDFCEAEQQGRLVVLPCKVGDTVYKLCPVSPFLKKGDLWSGRIIERDCDMCAYGACDCHDIGPQRDAKNIVHEMTLKSLSAIVRIIPHWGKLYFSSREEAEAALVADKNVGRKEG